MSASKFAMGDRVMAYPTRDNINVQSGFYVITRVMPREAEGQLYRAKHASDNHERVFREEDLTRAPK